MPAGPSLKLTWKGGLDFSGNLECLWEEDHSRLMNPDSSASAGRTPRHRRWPESALASKAQGVLGGESVLPAELPQRGSEGNTALAVCPSRRSACLQPVENIGPGETASTPSVVRSN